MKEMVSSIKTTLIPPNTARAVEGAVRREWRETTASLTPSVSIKGVPGEYDFRKFLTAPFEGMIAVQNSFGQATVNSIAVTTAKDAWESSRPEFVHGLFGPVQQGQDTSKWYTNLTNVQEGDTDFPTIRTYDDGYPPSRAVVSGGAGARPLAIKLVQETDTW